MTTVRIKFSQSVADVMLPPSDGSEAAQGELSGLFDAAVLLSSLIDGAYSAYSSWTFKDDVVRFNFDDGAYLTYSNVQFADPTAAVGKATATSRTLIAPDAVSLTQTGSFQLLHSLTLTDSGYQLAMGTLPGTVLTGFSVATHFPVGSGHYDPSVGNASFSFDGSVILKAGNILAGTVSRFTMGADKFLVSGLVEGDFDVEADVNAISAGTAYSTVTGTMRTHTSEFEDGSYLRVSDAAIFISDDTTVDADFFADPSRFPDDDDFNVQMPATLHRDVLLAAGAGHDSITVSGGGGKLNVAAGDGADRIIVLEGAHGIDGGAGTDTLVFAGARSSYTVSKTATGFTVQDAAGAVNVLAGVERIEFSDATLALDISGPGGQAYRLYQAAFNRTPDSAGLGFWIAALDHGVSLTSIADGFVQSAEYQEAYGGVRTNRDLVTRFYENILHRAPEQAGADFWTDALDKKSATVAEVLAAISESAENQSGLLPVIGEGFPYIPYG